MSNPTIELSKKQVINVLAQFPPEELKEIIDTLLKQKAFVPPSLEEITEEASRIVQRERLEPEIVDEAIKWARSKK
ncbi:hypothetical protein BMS3Bbin06_02320 [bacterium BMS3Bbin06]|nr:hypothetical protein BMS3Abin08_01246 [bacterium BMS3Abin08]GBE35776.1 hypothetical protein BMS3Bbin06_02320 [bacterium BMS3Bbin06]HDY71080.1 hypothetical protein [Nitrospirota bacterium]